MFSTSKQQQQSSPAWQAFERLRTRFQAGELIVLDGATGTELTKCLEVDAEQQWNGYPAQCFFPNAVEAVHKSYVDAGSDIITANTYGTNRHVMGIKSYAVDPSSVADANTKGVACARRAATAGSCHSIPTNKTNTYQPFTLHSQRNQVLVAGSMSNHPPAIASCGLTMDADFFDLCANGCCKLKSEDNDEIDLDSKTDGSNTDQSSSSSSSPQLTPTELGQWPSKSDELQNYREQAKWLAHAGCDVVRGLPVLFFVCIVRVLLVLFSYVGSPLCVCVLFFMFFDTCRSFWK